MSENLWPDFAAEPRPRTVRRVLLEAGSGLSERTDHQVKFVVRSRPVKKTRFEHECLLSAPLLEYLYPFCKVVEQGDPYPVVLYGDGTFEKGAAAGNEQALLENLRLLFNADSTKRLVQQLLDVVAAG